MRQRQSKSFGYSIITVGLFLCVACTSDKAKEERTANKSTELKPAKILSASQQKLMQLVGTWTTVRNSFIDMDEKFKGAMIATTAADSSGIYTIYNQGSGRSYYEASALWGCSESAKQIRVFEINNVGFIGTHIGYFDSTGTLILEYRDQENDILQQRTMRWSGDTLEMKAVIIYKGKTNEHYLTLTRQKD